MNSSFSLLLIASIVALSAGLLTWFVIDLGTTSMKRYRANFTENAKFQVQEFFLFIDPRRLFVVNIGIMILGTLLAWIVSGSMIIALPVFIFLALMRACFMHLCGNDGCVILKSNCLMH